LAASSLEVLRAGDLALHDLDVGADEGEGFAAEGEARAVDAHEVVGARGAEQQEER
jgi:hypothetical protein